MLTVMLALPAWAEPRYTVRDPNASFFDVPARRAVLRRADDPALRRAADLPPATCSTDRMVAPLTGTVRIPPYYQDGKKSPEWVRAAQPFFEFEKVIGEWSRRYAVSGEADDARCLVRFLDRWAQADSLTAFDYNARQSWHQIEWAAGGAALAYSMVRADKRLDPGAQKRIEEWLVRVVRHHISFPGSPRSDCCNNHLYWRALAAAATGVIASDNELFDWGLSKYRVAIGDMNPDGSWPLEMNRQDRALHYQSFAIEPLVTMAELAARQGYDLYSIRENGHTLKDAVDFLVRALADPALVRRYTSKPQDLAFARSLGWAEAYYRRFPDPRLEPYLGKAGRMTLYFHKPD